MLATGSKLVELIKDERVQRYAIVGAASAGAVASTSIILPALGFGATGVAAGSVGATLMAKGIGVGILQSVGAAGTGVGTKIILGAVGAKLGSWAERKVRAKL
jgi:hypothetical protein